MSASRATVDTRRFASMVRELAKRTGTTVERVVDGEVAAILSTAVSRTKAGKTVAQVRAEIASDTREWRTYRGRKYNVKPTALHNRSGKPRQNPGRGIRYPDFIWAQVQGLVRASHARRLAYARDARGLGKRQWVEIANTLGLTVKAPGYARTAKPNKAVTTASRRGGKGKLGKYSIQLSQGYLNNPYVRARGALQAAVNGRVGYFRRNVQAGVFADMRQVAGKYGAIAS
jgi:hypothetical protein